MLDSSGDGLHKRGYRPLHVEAPIRETLAAAILEISLWRRNAAHGEALFDPFCGSGTFLIEAAMMLSQRAPGLNRHFAAEQFSLVGSSAFDRQRELAKREILDFDSTWPSIGGSDLSDRALVSASNNAKRAGVASMIKLQKRDVRSWKWSMVTSWLDASSVLCVSNPPYGERLLTPEEATDLLKALSCIAFEPPGRLRTGVRLSVITSDEFAEVTLGARADKKRKLYNGRIRCDLYHYFKQSRDR